MNLFQIMNNNLTAIDLKHPGLRQNIIKFGIFLFGSVVVIVLVPDKAIDPWGLINLMLITMIVLTVIGIQFVAYVVLELWKTEGLLLIGGLIGIVNSNVMNGTMASISKQNPRLADHAAAAVVSGNIAMLVRNIIVVSTLSFTASKFILPPLISMVIAGIISIYFTLRNINQTIDDVGEKGIANPFEIRTALVYAGIITFVTIGGFLIHQIFGDTGLFLSAFFSVYAAGGPIIIAAVMLGLEGHITFLDAAIVVLIASFSSVSNDAILQLLCGAKDLAKSFVKISIPIVATGLFVLGIELLIF